MIEGAILVIELALFLVLLIKVWRVQQKGEGEHKGFFGYRIDKAVAPPPDLPDRPARRRPNA